MRRGKLNPLVGRDAEAAQLRDALDRLERGEGTAVVLEGEPGIGKTRLTEHALSEAGEREFEVMRGGCRELEGDLPFAPIAEALGLDETAQADSHRRAARELLYGENPRAESDAERRVRVLHALRGVVESSCERRGTVLAIEDLHWANEQTLLLLERLGRRCAHVPLLLLLTMRPYPRRPELEALLASLAAGGQEHIGLAPLDGDEVTMLVEASLGAPPGQRLLGAMAGTGGNPLFVAEVLAMLEQQGALTVGADGVIDAVRVESAHSLRLAILRRLTFLPKPCVELLRAASLLGSEFDIGELSVVTGRPPHELGPILSDAVESKVVGEAGSHLAFRHDMVREAIYKDRPMAVREALHYDAACKLRDAGHSPLKVAAHLLRGTTGADREAIELLRSTARECIKRDPATAVELLERAAALIPADGATANDLTAELARALMVVGRWTEGELLARELVAAERNPEASLEVLVTRVHVAALHGVLPEPVLAELDVAAHAARSASPERARLLAAATQAAFLCGDLGRARALAGEALDASRDAGDAVTQAETMSMLSTLCWHEGRPAEGLAAAEHGIALRSRLPEGAGVDVQMPFLNLAMNLALLQRFEEATGAFQRAMELAERANNVWALGLIHQMSGVSQFLAGDLGAAEGEFEAALELWDELEARYWGVTQRAWLARIALHRGDLSKAQGQLAVVDAGLPPGSAWAPARNVPVVSHTRALVAEADGDVGAAFAALEDARRAIAASGAAYFNLRIGPEHVRFALAAGEREAAEEMAAATEAVAGTVGTDTARGQALRCRGLLAGDAEIVLDAVAALRQGPSRIEFAGAAEEAARALAANGATGESPTALLQDALEVWEGAGASHDAARVVGRLRELGASPGKRGPRRRAETGWDSLTDSERRVADLVREGLTYREVGERLFISRRTVETHAARVFVKLGVRSRAQLAALSIEGEPVTVQG
jgi:DNA-binding CsgD family transcriptional regulator